MSWKCVRRVLAHSSTSASSRLVLVVIAEHAREDGTNSFCSAQTLANETGLSVRQVRTLLHKLQATGELLIEERLGTTSMYTVNIRPDKNCRGECCKRGQSDEQKLQGSPAEIAPSHTKTAGEACTPLQTSNQYLTVPNQSLEQSRLKTARDYARPEEKNGDATKRVTSFEALRASKRDWVAGVTAREPIEEAIPTRRVIPDT